MDVCTIIAKNYIPHARVLARSLAEHDSDTRFSALVIDDFEGYFAAETEPFELLSPSDINCDEFDSMAARYDVLELATGLKPWLLRHLLKRGAATVTYLDADIQVFGSLAVLEQLGVEHGLVLIPHNTAPIPFDGERPTQVDIMVAGAFNLGYITLAAGSQADQLLDWWSERLRRDCRVDPAYGYFVDQRWMDVVPGMVSDFALVRGPEFNVAYWNLHARDLQHDGERYTVNLRPLAFFHFSGFDPDRPQELSRHQSRISVAERPAVARICREYASALDASGYAVARSWPYGHGVLPDGTPFSTVLRRLFSEGEDRGELHRSPLQEAGHEAFLDWLGGHEEGAPPGVTRLLAGLYEQRTDLQKAFPDLFSTDRVGYLKWAAEVGVTELGLPPRLAPASETTMPGIRALSPLPPPAAEAPIGVNVVGYAGSEPAVGEAARQVVSALDGVGVPLLPLQGRTSPLNPLGNPFTSLELGEARYPVDLICMNAEALPEFARQAAEGFFEGRYSIGLCLWERSAQPLEDWGDAFAVLDEVWAPSHYVADTISSVTDTPVIRVALPVELPSKAPLPRHALDLPQDDFLFLFSFEYRGAFERENPLGVLEAFRAAFEPGSGATLVLNGINADSDPVSRARLHEAVADRPDVRMIEHHLAADTKNALTAACDCYVSLHRAESLGLRIAEAMFLGMPVIATGYSGNTDFMTAWNSYLVECKLVPVGAGTPTHPAGGVWAQPSVEHAAALMREVFEHPAQARERGRRAAVDIRTRHSPLAAGTQMVRRLGRARARAIGEGRAAFVTPSMPSIGPLAERVARGTETAPKPTLLRHAARRAVLRVIKPFTAHQLLVNAGVVQGLQHLQSSLDALAADQLRVDAERLRQARADAAQLESLRTAIVERIEDHERRLKITEAETHAIPFMAGQPFVRRRDPVAGVVLGYTSPNGAGAENEYREFEDVFRGSEQFIRDRQRRYLPIIGDRQPVLDFGCGRGELLDLLRDAGISCTGVDSDASMLARCAQKGHTDVVHADGLEYLEQLPDGGLGAIFSAQVIEHLTEQQLRRLLELAWRKLAREGILIAETVNPHSPPALKTFWVDLTHQRPIFPEAALELCREAGFGSAYFFHPNGTGDVERDRFSQGEFAVVASVEAGSAARAETGSGHWSIAHDLDDADMPTSRTPRAGSGAA